MSFVGIFGVLFLLLSLAGLVWLWISVLRQPRDRAPKCGQCGYLVAGLQTLACPECGSDLREVGITSPTARLLSPVVFLLAWTLLLPIPAALLSGLALQAAPRTRSATYTIDVAPLSGSFPQLRLLVEYEGRGRGALNVGSAKMQSTSDGVTQASTFTLPIAAGGRAVLDRAQVRVPAAGGQVTSVAPGTTATNPSFDLPLDGLDASDRTALRTFVDGQRSADTRAAQDTEFELDVAELDALATAILAGQPAFTSTRLQGVGITTNSGRPHTPPWIPAIIVLFWIAAYAGGIALFLKRRRAAHGGPDRA